MTARQRTLVLVAGKPRPACDVCDGSGLMRLLSLIPARSSRGIPTAAVTPCLHCSPPRGFELAPVWPQHINDPRSA